MVTCVVELQAVFAQRMPLWTFGASVSTEEDRPLRFVQGFIVDKVKGLIFFDGPADALRLMAAKRPEYLIEKFLASSALLRWK